MSSVGVVLIKVNLSFMRGLRLAILLLRLRARLGLRFKTVDFRRKVPVSVWFFFKSVPIRVSSVAKTPITKFCLPFAPLRLCVKKPSRGSSVICVYLCLLPIIGSMLKIWSPIIGGKVWTPA